MKRGEIQSLVLPYLNLYDAWELAAVSQLANRWTHSLPWYKELKVSPKDYVQIRMDLPSRTFSMLQSLAINLSHNNGKPTGDEGILRSLAVHMTHARKYLPRLQRLHVELTLASEVDMHNPQPRIENLLVILSGMSHIKHLKLDFHGVPLEQFELSLILRKIQASSKLESFDMHLRATTPAPRGSWISAHPADIWVGSLAGSLACFQSLSLLCLTIEVPLLPTTQRILTAGLTNLVMHNHGMDDGQKVMYTSNGEEARNRAALDNLKFFARATTRDRLELYETRAQAMATDGFGQPTDGRQLFVPQSRGNCGSLTLLDGESSKVGEGVQALSEAVAKMPELKVKLVGRGFFVKSFAAASKNVQLLLA